MSTRPCQITATWGRRAVRVVGDPHAPYVTSLKSMGWTVTTTPLPAPTSPFPPIPTPPVEAIP